MKPELDGAWIGELTVCTSRKWFGGIISKNLIEDRVAMSRTLNLCFVATGRVAGAVHVVILSNINNII